MFNTQRRLIALADGEHVRFVRAGADNVLRTHTAADALAAHKRNAELGDDRPGASFHTGSTAHHSIAPRHDLHAHQKEKFARSVADQLNEAEAQGAFGTLLLAAHAHTLNDIRAHLNGATAARLVVTLAKDLLKTPDHALAPHFLDWIKPAKHVPPYTESVGG